MDVPRSPEILRRRKRRRVVVGIAGAAGLLLTTLGLSRLKPAAPPVDRATVWIRPVERGPMVREAHGLGTLVPEEIR